MLNKKLGLLLIVLALSACGSQEEKAEDTHKNEHEHHHGDDGHADEHEHHHGEGADESENNHHHDH